MPAFRRKSKQALRDYKKVLLQLETLEINVGDQCRKEFTGRRRPAAASAGVNTATPGLRNRSRLSPDLMTEMMDLSSDVGGPGLPLLDYKTYAERVFFPGQHVAPLTRQLDLPESRRQTVEQGLQQLNNLLNNRLFLTRVGGGPPRGPGGPRPQGPAGDRVFCVRSSSTPWRPSRGSPRGTGATWPASSPWPCTTSWSTSPRL